MKNLLAVLMFLPLCGMAQQENNTTPKTPKNELGINIGTALDNVGGNALGIDNKTGRFTINALRNFGNTQIGFTVEGGTNTGDYWYTMPGVLVNQKISVGKSYIYAGGMAGYVRNVSRDYIQFNYPNAQNGYVLGVQAGYSLYLSRHWSFISEVAFRSVQTWSSFYLYKTLPQPNVEAVRYHAVVRDFNMYMPVTVGVRYKF